MTGPVPIANRPTGNSGQLCRPNTRSRREAVEQTLGDHPAAAAAVLAAEFLGRLEDQVDRAVEVPGLGQIARGAQQHRRVPVMAAGVHEPRP